MKKMREGHMKTFNERLRELRQDNDLSQSHVAEILRTTQQHYSEYETGKVQMPFHHIITLAKHYGVSMDYLFGLVNEDVSSVGNVAVTRTCTSNDLIRRVLSLTQEGRDRAVDYISLLQLKYKER